MLINLVSAVGVEMRTSHFTGQDVMRNIKMLETEVSDLQRIADDLMKSECPHALSHLYS